MQNEKIIQIAGTNDTLYALTESGKIYKHEGVRWKMLRDAGEVTIDDINM